MKKTFFIVIFLILMAIAIFFLLKYKGVFTEIKHYEKKRKISFFLKHISDSHSVSEYISGIERMGRENINISDYVNSKVEVDGVLMNNGKIMFYYLQDENNQNKKLYLNIDKNDYSNYKKFLKKKVKVIGKLEINKSNNDFLWIIVNKIRLINAEK